MKDPPPNGGGPSPSSRGVGVQSRQRCVAPHAPRPFVSKPPPTPSHSFTFSHTHASVAYSVSHKLLVVCLCPFELSLTLHSSRNFDLSSTHLLHQALPTGRPLPVDEHAGLAGTAKPGRQRHRCIRSPSSSPIRTARPSPQSRTCSASYVAGSDPPFSYSLTPIV